MHAFVPSTLRIVETDEGTPHLPPASVRALRQANRDTLVRRLRAGDPVAQREILTAHTHDVERVLTRILGFTSDLDDLVQEVFVRGFDRIDRIRPETHPRSWFVGIAVVVAKEALRQRARRRWLSFRAPDHLPEVPARDVSSERTTDARRALEDVYTILDSMGFDLRTAFVLRHLDGMEIADMATACGTSVATIKRRVNTAVGLFRARAERFPALAAWMKESAK